MQLFGRIYLVVGLVAVSGCYSQRPIHSTPPAEARIVAAVTDTGTVLMANSIGPAATEVEGIIQGADADALIIQLLRVDHRGGSSVMWNREPVRFPRVALTSMRERELDRTRSWMAGGLAVAGALALAKIFGTASGDDIPSRSGPIGPPN